MSTVRSQHISFNLTPHETLLEGLERTGHEVEYQCRGGYCGLCRVRLIDGEVRYLEQPLAFVAADEILPCCCIPKSDIQIDCQLRTELRNWEVQEDLFPVQQSLFNDLWQSEAPASRAKKRRRVSSPGSSKPEQGVLFT